MICDKSINHWYLVETIIIIIDILSVPYDIVQKTLIVVRYVFGTYLDLFYTSINVINTMRMDPEGVCSCCKNLKKVSYP